MQTLTPAQVLAIESRSREILVCAAAGSGKTHCLAERVARLIREGATPEQFLILSFTRKSAREMRERIESATGCDMAGALCSTFHSVCLSLLRAHGKELGYNPDTITIIDTDDADELLRMAARDRGLLKPTEKGPKWKAGYSFDKCKKWLEIAYSASKIQGGDAGHLVCRYRKLLFFMNSLDFGSLLLEVNTLFNLRPPVLAAYRERIKFVFVDESQDADRTQYILHEWFDRAAFFGVGDLRQCIYGFRGAAPELMTERNPNAETIDLQECFRCGDDIVSVANRLIAHNGDFAPLVGATNRTGKVSVITGRSADVIAYAGQVVEAGFRWGDIAIIARAHSTLKRLEWCATEADVPAYRVGKEKAKTDGPEFKDVLACLRLVANPRDDLAFIRLAGIVGMMNERFAALRETAARRGISMFRAFIQADDSSAFPIVNALATSYREHNVVEVAGLITVHLPLSLKYAGAVGWWARHCATMNVRDALEWYALIDSHDEIEKRDAVTLLTAHAAKGLEWPVVIVCGLNEGDFPTARAIRSEEVPDERRVAYVAFTRAREQLVLHYRGPDDYSPGTPIKPPSRFIEEAGFVGVGLNGCSEQGKSNGEKEERTESIT